MRNLRPKSLKENQNGRWRKLSIPDSMDVTKSSNSLFDGRDFPHQKILGYLSRIFPLRTYEKTSMPLIPVPLGNCYLGTQNEESKSDDNSDQHVEESFINSRGSP